jgi:hypothetical protein
MGNSSGEIAGSNAGSVERFANLPFPDLDDLAGASQRFGGFNRGVPKERQCGLMDGTGQWGERSFEVNPEPSASCRTWSGIVDRDVLRLPAGRQVVPQDGGEFLVHNPRCERADGRSLAVELRPASEERQDEAAFYVFAFIDG